jgi:hypothetical protein
MALLAIELFPSALVVRLFAGYALWMAGNAEACACYFDQFGGHRRMGNMTRIARSGWMLQAPFDDFVALGAKLSSFIAER